jgi:putative hydrolase of the HAD superfamily
VIKGDLTTIRAVCFDVAGTLYVSAEFDALVDRQAEAALADALGCDLEEAARKLDAQRKANTKQFGDKSKVRALEALGVSREEFHGAVSALDPGPYLADAAQLGDTFSRLRDGGYRIGILSNFRRVLISKILACLGLSWDQVDASICEDDGLPIKPSPVPFRTMCERLGQTPQASLFVGDSISKDLIPANGIGMRTLLVGCGEDDADPAVADAQIEDVRSIVDVLALP